MIEDEVISSKRTTPAIAWALFAMLSLLVSYGWRSGTRLLAIPDRIDNRTIMVRSDAAHDVSPTSISGAI